MFIDIAPCSVIPNLAANSTQFTAVAMDIQTPVKVKLLLSPRQSRGFTRFNYKGGVGEVATVREQRQERQQEIVKQRGLQR